ncbi:unnamed protein product, partial [Brenthis ino]
METGKCSGTDLHAKLLQLQRTLEAVKGKRRGEDYKRLVETFLEESSIPAPVLSASGRRNKDRSGVGQSPGAQDECTSADMPPADEPYTAIRASISPNAEQVLSKFLLLWVAEKRRKRCKLRARAARRLHLYGIDG